MKSLLCRLYVAFSTVCLPGSMVKAEQVQATIRSVNEAVELRLNTVSNRHYEIHDSASLAGWAPVETAIPGTGAEIVRTYPTNGVPKRFFQIVAVTVPASLAPIPTGGFIMGNSIAGDDIPDAPQHPVILSGFYMARNPVTKTEWDTVRSSAISSGYSDLPVGSGKAGNHPVQTVSWWDCIKYCNARSQQEGLVPVYTVGGAVMKTGDTTVPTVDWKANGYRLPTEAEWEKAARGGLSGKRFPWGDTTSHSQANYFGSDIDSYDLSVVKDYHPDYDLGGFPYTSPVGSFGGNGYALKDMAGNVWQWCWDWYGTYDTGSPTDPRGASSGTFRVVRGGSWDDPASNCRVAYRNPVTPDNTSDTFGFRVVRSSVR